MFIANTTVHWSDLHSLEDLRRAEVDGKLNTPAIYLWGWLNKDETTFYPYYVGKARNLRSRLFEHVGKLIGGQYAIYDYDFIQSDEFKLLKEVGKDLLYMPSGMESFWKFMQDEKIQANVTKLIKNIQFCWSVTQVDQNAELEKAVYELISRRRPLGSTVRGKSSLVNLQFTGNSAMDKYIPMGYSFEKTICVYTHSSSVLEVVRQVATERNMDVFVAEDEADLVGVPYWLAVVDANLIGTVFINYMEDVMDDQAGTVVEKFISHTSTTPLPGWLAEMFLEVEAFDVDSFQRSYTILSHKA